MTADTQPAVGVVYWDEGPARTRSVIKFCAICYRDTDLDVGDVFVVSPSGVAHHVADGGMTGCGRDATGPEWWWRP